MDISMKTYQSKTGYVKRVDGTCYEAKTIYLGKYDKAENYEDINEKEYKEYVTNQNKGLQNPSID